MSQGEALYHIVEHNVVYNVVEAIHNLEPIIEIIIVNVKVVFSLVICLNVNQIVMNDRKGHVILILATVPRHNLTHVSCHRLNLGRVTDSHVNGAETYVETQNNFVGANFNGLQGQSLNMTDKA